MKSIAVIVSFSADVFPFFSIFENGEKFGFVTEFRFCSAMLRWLMLTWTFLEQLSLKLNI